MPDDLHIVLKARAAQAGMSLSDYLLSQLRAHASVPTPAEMLARLESVSRIELRPGAAELVRDERDSR